MKKNDICKNICGKSAAVTLNNVKKVAIHLGKLLGNRVQWNVYRNTKLKDVLTALDVGNGKTFKTKEDITLNAIQTKKYRFQTILGIVSIVS